METGQQPNRLEVPPQSLAEVESALTLKTRYVYMVFGGIESRAWKVAMALGNDFPDLYVIRIEVKDTASKWLGDKDPAGIFFSNCGVPKRYLSQVEADDRTTTRKIIREVKKEKC